jgi:hypothetical protein
MIFSRRILAALARFMAVTQSHAYVEVTNNGRQSRKNGGCCFAKGRLVCRKLSAAKQT